MKLNESLITKITKTVKGLDRILDTVIIFVVVIAMLYGGYGLYDTYTIYNQASNNQDILKYKPDFVNNENTHELSDLNEDICAWLTIDDTHIDYPVVQGEDNAEYLNKDVEGNYSLTGSLFLDYRNQNNFKDFYSLIYGHSLEGNYMFGIISKYLNKDFFNDHLTGTISINNQQYDLEIFACVFGDAYDDMIYNPHIYIGNENAKLLKYIKDNARVYRDIEVNGKDRIIGMSTCYDMTTNGRVIVFAKIND